MTGPEGQQASCQERRAQGWIRPISLGETGSSGPHLETPDSRLREHDNDDGENVDVENYYYDDEKYDGDNDDLDESGAQGEEVRVASVKEPSARHLHHKQYHDEEKHEETTKGVNFDQNSHRARVGEFQFVNCVFLLLPGYNLS